MTATAHVTISSGTAQPCTRPHAFWVIVPVVPSKARNTQPTDTCSDPGERHGVVRPNAPKIAAAAPKPTAQNKMTSCAVPPSN